jgi:hypothetical protein
VLIFLFSFIAAAGTPLSTCGTPGLISEFLGRDRPPSVPPSPDWVDHESHGDVPNVQYSTHFALKWGPDHPPTEADSARLLADFEYAYTVEVETWEMADPTGFGGSFFNVYIGDTGADVPSVMGNAGYYTLDPDGFPMIVISNEIIGDPSYIRSVIAHEFFHAVQHAEDAFYYEDTGVWYWEATACWAQGQVVPESQAFFGFLPWYALQPAAGMYQFSYDTYGGAPPDLHQYGAFIFPWYISETLHEPQAILASWHLGTPTSDPLFILETILTEAVFARAIADHGARNLVWDYALGEQFSAHVEAWSEHFPAQDLRHATLIESPEDGLYRVDSMFHPKAAGYALVQIPPDAVTPAGRLTVLLKYDVEATTPPQPAHVDLRATLIEITDVETHYLPVRSDIPHTNFWVTEGAELWLSVANTGLMSEAAYPAPFTLSFVPLPEAPEPEDTGDPPTNITDTGEDTPWDDGGLNPNENLPEEDDYVVPTASNDDDEKAGCGCTAAHTAPVSALIFLLPLLVIRRSDNQGL